MFEENAQRAGLAYDQPPLVRREFVVVDQTGRRLSALIWGTADPQVVLLQGGGQNAHTWDTVLLALGRPAVAVDLPGHGHSEGRLPPGNRCGGTRWKLPRLRALFARSRGWSWPCRSAA
jgi:pimeloyl-ACP methyl ester carboxylesterase